MGCAGAGGFRANREYELTRRFYFAVGFRPVAGDVALSPAAANAAHSAGVGKTAPAPILSPSVLSTTQWNQLVTRIGALPAPKVASKPSSAAIKDPNLPKTGR